MRIDVSLGNSRYLLDEKGFKFEARRMSEDDWSLSKVTQKGEICKALDWEREYFYHYLDESAEAAFVKWCEDTHPLIEINEEGGKQSKLDYRVDLVPTKALLRVAKVLSEGAEKYGEENWQLIPTRDHLNHALTHIFKFMTGDKTEEHLTNALCRLFFASWCYYDDHSKGEDDD